MANLQNNFLILCKLIIKLDKRPSISIQKSSYFGVRNVKATLCWTITIILNTEINSIVPVLHQWVFFHYYQLHNVLMPELIIMMSLIALHNQYNNYLVIKCDERKKFHKVINTDDDNLDLVAATKLIDTLYQSHNEQNPANNWLYFNWSVYVPVNCDVFDYSLSEIQWCTTYSQVW